MLPIISAGFPFIPTILWGGIAVRRYFVNPGKDRNGIRDQIQEDNIRELFRPILEENGIRNDLQFRLDSIKGAACAGGNFTKYATIFVCPEFREIDEAAFRFAVKHEIGHIKNNDTIRPAVLAMIVSIAFAILFPYAVGTSIVAGVVTCLTSILLTLVIYGLTVRYQEKRADDFAIANASSEELSGAIRLHKTVIDLCEEEGKPDNHGLHPSTLSRIEKCEQELRKRGQVYRETPLDILKKFNMRRLLLDEPILTVNDFIEAVNADRRLRAVGPELTQADFA